LRIIWSNGTFANSVPIESADKFIPRVGIIRFTI
jgi:hypothetical protein